MKLIDDHSGISKIEAGKLNIERRDTSLRISFRDLPPCPARHREADSFNYFPKEPASKPYHGPGVGQLSSNIIGNAIKFTEAEKFH